jgi:outer membrane protein TolC
MKKIFLLIVCFFIINLANSNGKIIKLSLKECVEIGIKNNLNIKEEKINVEQSKTDIEKAKGNFYPNLSLSGKYSDQNTPSTSSIEQVETLNEKNIDYDVSVNSKIPSGANASVSFSNNRLSSNSEDVVFNPAYSSGLAIYLSQPLLKGFGISINTTELTTAKIAKELAVLAFYEKVNEIISKIAKYYINLSLAQYNLKIKENLLKNSEGHLKDTEEKIKIGILPKSDVVIVEDSIIEKTSSVISQRKTLKDAYANLANVLGYEKENILQFNIELSDEFILKEEKINKNEIINYAFLNNYSLNQAKKSFDIENILLKYKKNSTYPSLDLFGSFTLNGIAQSYSSDLDLLVSGDSRVWQTGVKLSIPLGNKQAKSDFFKQKLETQKAILNIKKIENNIVYDIDEKVREIELAYELAKLAEKKLKYAKEKLLNEEEKFKLGKSTMKNIIDYQKDLENTELDRVGKSHDYFRALYDLWEEEGNLIKRFNILVKNEI